MICKAPQALNRGGWYHLSFAPENGPLTVHKTRYDKHDLYSPAGKGVQFHPAPQFPFEAPTFQPLSNEAKVLYAFVLRRAELSEERLGGRVRAGLPVLPICEVVALLRCGGRKRSTPCGSCSMRGWWKSRNRAVENPTAFTRNPMKRFQTPTSRNPVMVRRRAENRTWRVRKSILLKYGNLTVYRNTEIKTIYLHSFHSNPIRDIFGGKPAGKGMEWGKEFNGTTRNFAI